MTYFSDMSIPRQVWEIAGGAIVMGAVTGALLGMNAWAYVGGIIVSVVGGLPSGGQHRTIRSALLRGIVSGVLWTVALLVVRAVSNASPAAELPEIPLLLVISAVITAAIAVASQAVTSKRHSRVGSIG